MSCVIYKRKLPHDSMTEAYQKRRIELQAEIASKNTTDRTTYFTDIAIISRFQMCWWYHFSDWLTREASKGALKHEGLEPKRVESLGEPCHPILTVDELTTSIACPLPSIHLFLGVFVLEQPPSSITSASAPAPID